MDVLLLALSDLSAFATAHPFISAGVLAALSGMLLGSGSGNRYP